MALVAALAAWATPSPAPAAPPDQNPGHHTGQTVGVMTRNLYLGADLSPAIGAPNLPAFVAANGAILRQVTRTDFPTRAKGLADEILSKKPDLVGLQEVALWRTGPPSLAPVLGGPKTATTVRYDFLQLLLDQLNKDRQLYRAAVVEPEFDFEAPADENGVSGDGPAPISNAELNARLTMRDVILVRRQGGVKVSNEQGGHFNHLLVLSIVGQSVTVTRGWTRVDAQVRGSPPFRFVNTHLEAFDNGTIRAQQAEELVASGGPADSKQPVVLLGDLNSDDGTVNGNDRLAYLKLLDAGFVERSTDNPLSCCIHDPNLQSGTAAEFDHQVDHVLTDSPDDVKLADSSVTGREKHNGLWDSDHAGVFSLLRIPAGLGPKPEAPPDNAASESPAGSEPNSNTGTSNSP